MQGPPELHSEILPQKAKQKNVVVYTLCSVINTYYRYINLENRIVGNTTYFCKLKWAIIKLISMLS
jgi:hypothetical protein